jgi:hypothetical protein
MSNIIRPYGSRTHDPMAIANIIQGMFSNLSRSFRPHHKHQNHRRAELRRRLGSAKYRAHVAGEPVRGLTPLATVYDEVVAFKQLANEYLDNVRAIDAERLSRQYPAMPEPK